MSCAFGQVSCFRCDHGSRISLKFINLVSTVTHCDTNPFSFHTKKKHGSWANLKGGGQLASKTGNGEQMCGMTPGLGSVSGCPHIPAATSVRCVWTQVHAGVVGISCDQPVRDRCVVFDFVARWKEGFMSMLNRNFARL